MGNFGGVFAGDDEPALHECGEDVGVRVVDEELVEWRAAAYVVGALAGFGETHEHVACDRLLVDAEAFVAVFGEASDRASDAACLFVPDDREGDTATSFPGTDERGRQ